MQLKMKIEFIFLFFFYCSACMAMEDDPSSNQSNSSATSETQREAKRLKRDSPDNDITESQVKDVVQEIPRLYEKCQEHLITIFDKDPRSFQSLIAPYHPLPDCLKEAFANEIFKRVESLEEEHREKGHNFLKGLSEIKELVEGTPKLQMLQNIYQQAIPELLKYDPKRRYKRPYIYVRDDDNEKIKWDDCWDRSEKNPDEKVTCSKCGLRPSDIIHCCLGKPFSFIITLKPSVSVTALHSLGGILYAMENIKTITLVGYNAKNLIELQTICAYFPLINISALVFGDINTSSKKTFSEPIVETIKKIKTLESISIIGKYAAQSAPNLPRLLEAIKSCPALHILKLHHFKLTRKQALALTDLIQNSTIRKVSLVEVGIYKDELSLLSIAAQRNNLFETLELTIEGKASLHHGYPGGYPTDEGTDQGVAMIKIAKGNPKIIWNDYLYHWDFDRLERENLL